LVAVTVVGVVDEIEVSAVADEVDVVVGDDDDDALVISFVLACFLVADKGSV